MTNQARLELLIDVFDKKAQRALALPTITPPELVEAVLQEFREIEYLGAAPNEYSLLKAADHAPLNNDSQIGQQLAPNEQLLLSENVAPVPKNAQRLTQHVYLREQAAGTVYKLHWQPAIIGRPDKQTRNELLAVNLGAHAAGAHVSRRHAQISEENGSFYITSLSQQNPTSIRDAKGAIIAMLGAQKHPLQHGDIISLDYSRIMLKFIIRST
jgi:hypothetical protein